MATIPNWLHQRAYLTPNRLALKFGKQRWTFRELDQRVDWVARRLAGLGIEEGSRIALLMRNSPDFAMMVHAVTRIGAMLIPLNIRLTPTEIAWQVADAEANALIYDESNTSTAGLIAQHLPKLQLVSTNGDPIGNAIALNEAPDTHVSLLDDVDLSAVHSIIYTSGTTGKPKGALLSYNNLWWSASGSAFNLGVHNDDVWLAVLPLFHVGGLSILIRSVIYGNTAIIHQSFDPAAVNRSIDEDRVSIISVVSTMLQRMLDERGDKPYPSTLRCVLLGGGPAPRPLLETCAARNIPVVQTYGLTETSSQIATLPPEDALRKLGSAGKPLFPSELRIEDDGRQLLAGEVGEIVVRGPTVSAGYIEPLDSTIKKPNGGWLRTGDLGYLDDEGYLYVVSRRNDLIISGGENIYPAEVEAVLLAHPAVEEVGVIGVPDAEWGQAPAAAIKVRAGKDVSPEELYAFCEARLAHFKIPAHFWFVEWLPRNASGKLLRPMLAEDWQKHHP